MEKIEGRQEYHSFWTRTMFILLLNEAFRWKLMKMMSCAIKGGIKGENAKN